MDSSMLEAKEDVVKRRMTMPSGRKSLSDITNVATGNQQVLQFRTGDQDLVKAVLSASSKDYITQLVKENSALLRLLEEKNKVIEMNNIELQKLRETLQKINQQNWLLAQTNSHMLAELNNGKDRVKSLQHELVCTSAILKEKSKELVEAKKKKKLLKQLSNKDVTDPVHIASHKKACNLTRKRMLRSQSLGPSISTHLTAAEVKDDDRRRSLRRKSSHLKNEPTEDLFEIEDIKCPIRPSMNEIVADSSSSKQAIASDSFISNSVMSHVKTELQQGIASPKGEKIWPRRSSLGRPLRRAVEKVSCYKETPLNCKMRRD